MKEIEIKVRLDDLDEVVLRLVKLGCNMTEPRAQEDIVFLREATSDYRIERGAVVARIRKESDRSILTLKQKLGGEMNSKELETEISSPQIMYQMLNLLGFKEMVRVKKTRAEAHYQNHTICVDQVEGLGNFIEIECMTERHDSASVQNEMLSFLQDIGVDVSERVTTPYDTMVYRLNTTANS